MSRATGTPPGSTRPSGTGISRPPGLPACRSWMLGGMTCLFEVLNYLYSPWARYFVADVIFCRVPEMPAVRPWVGSRAAVLVA